MAVNKGVVCARVGSSSRARRCRLRRTALRPVGRGRARPGSGSRWRSPARRRRGGRPGPPQGSGAPVGQDADRPAVGIERELPALRVVAGRGQGGITNQFPTKRRATEIRHGRWLPGAVGDRVVAVRRGVLGTTGGRQRRGRQQGRGRSESPACDHGCSVRSDGRSAWRSAWRSALSSAARAATGQARPQRSRRSVRWPTRNHGPDPQHPDLRSTTRGLPCPRPT
jgi:hypothetical protein